MIHFTAVLARGALALLVLTACTDERASQRHRPSATELSVRQEPLEPLREPEAQDPARVALGARLFSDKRLSADGSVACASCHVLDRAGQDGLKVSVGIHGASGNVNAPTVLNSGFNFVQFWDGRAATLEDQVSGPLTNASEMDSDWARTLTFLNTNQEYLRRFHAAFPDGVTEANVRSALASFERTLTTPNARFDTWLRGDQAALTETEKIGYERFKAVGCVACHQGSNVGGNMFQRFGVMGEYFADRGHVSEADYGRFNVTHLDADRFVFRVPSLRNVELTAPYFHDGSATTLEQAVATMAKYQLGQSLDATTTAQIVAFLKTLTGHLPELERGPALVAERPSK